MTFFMRLNNVSIRSKLVFLSFLVLCALLVPSYLFYQHTQVDIDILKTAIKGQPVTRNGVTLAKLFAEHRGLSARYLNGDENARMLIINKGGEIANQLNAFKQQIADSGSEDMAAELETISSSWNVLKANVPQNTIEARSSFEQHSLLIRQMHHLLEITIRHYQMTYLQSAVAYNLTISSAVDLPIVTDKLGQIRGHGAGILSAKKASDSDIAILNSYMVGMSQALQNLNDHVQLVSRSGVGLPAVETLTLSAEGLLLNAENEIINATTITQDAGTFFDEATRIIGEFYQFNDQMTQVLSSTLDENLASLQWQQRLSLLFIGFIACLTLGMFYAITRSINIGVTKTVNALSDIAEGDYSFDAAVIRKDEFGSIGRTLVEVAAKLRHFKNVSIEAIRVKQALDNSSTCYMIANTNREIIYMNDSVITMLSEAEGDIRKDLPQFSIKHLLGKSIDEFHKNPHHQRGILDKLRETYTTTISLGNFTFRLIVNPIFNEDKAIIGHSVEWHDMTDFFEKERRIARLLESLDCASTNVMIADADRKIIYMNKAVTKMLRAVESDLQQELPNFNVDTVLGSSIDDFHTDPAHQMKLLGELTTTYQAKIQVGRRHFKLTANPIISESGERLGSVVEWLDRTKEIEAEQEIEALVKAAVHGDFSVRADDTDKTGFQHVLTCGLNDLLDIAEQGLSEVSKILLAISEGDLTQKIEKDFEGTFEQLRLYCNKTSQNLAEIVYEIRTASSSLSITSSEIALGNKDLSSRTEQQASTLEETASSMEQINSAVRNTALNAQQASMLATQASEMATTGGALVDGVVDTMAQINGSAKQIEDIIGVIDGIAFQTNILALNAAVEAARAGEQGRGFAVVASEVRTLAKRSASSAKDIKALISDSVSRIETGNALVIQSGKSIAEVVEVVRQVSDLITDIATASEQQASGIDEVNKAVAGMDDMTQQNAAMVEQAAAAAESMHALAQQLEERVKAFNIGEFSLDALHAPAKPLPPPDTMPKPQSKGYEDDDDWESF
ncbi:PAS domain-containing protein [Alteromonas sediminis]|uniref:PAS domain-containing protein n=1 Tax=Alteromonas sediminis TaxID=2259342 RepID=A0A3N5Y4R6_9ALTE|nr:methyl-accepting chemotaxis protein [Alteromonas sediminis]RPJ68600.1 PAS domain-containing protein [Alteromonas sediminis]